MSNFSVNSAHAAKATAAPAPSQAPAQTKAAAAEARPASGGSQALASPDHSQAKALPAGGAVQSVELVDTSGPTPAELQWAQALKKKMGEGYQPAPAEVAMYNKILSAQHPQDMRPVTAAELTWATEFEARIAKGAQASPEDIAKYNDIFTRYQAANQAVPAAPAAPGTPATQAAPANLKAKFHDLDQLLAKKQYIVTGPPADPEKTRQTAVQIWIDGKPEDRLNLAQKLVANGQSEVLGRILSHQETNEVEVASLLAQKDFPVEKLMKGLDDNHAFLVLNSLAAVAVTGEASSAKVLEKAVTAFDRVWDREAPFKQLKTNLQAHGQWDKLPDGLRGKIDQLLK